MRRVLRLSSTIIYVAFICGCVPSVSVTPLLDSGLPPRDDTAPIAVYYTKVPVCPYEEIAILEATPSELDMVGTSESMFVDALKKKARELGGSALILGPAYRSISSLSRDATGNVQVNETSSQEGVVIRFTSSDCQE